MLRSKLANTANDELSEDIIELSEANPNSSCVHLSNFLESKKFEKEEKNGSKHSLSTQKKRFDNENFENSETANLIYPYTTLRTSKTSPEIMEKMEEHATTITSIIERKNKLMQDDPVSELMRLEMIRNMPESLTLKRSVKAKLTLSVTNRSKKRTISYWRKLQYETSISIAKTKLLFRQIGSSLEFWYHPIKIIQGHFGSGVATYFKFLRWLFIVNIISCLFSILFVTVPQSLVQSHQNESFSSWDLVLGNGLFTNSILYYGFHTNNTIMVDSEVAYDMPSAYFSTFLFCYIFTFVILCFKVARSYKKCYIETSGGAYNRYANKIFCSWDWGISSYKAASLRSASIYRELEELLWDSKHSSTSISCSMKVCTLLIRVAMTTLIFAVMCGTGALLWLLLNEHEADETSITSVLTVPVVLTIIINVFPPVITWSVKYERYVKDRIAFYISMIRVYAIAVMAVATLLTFWLTRGVQVVCWQTRLAQEIYRLILLDLLVSVFGSFIFQLIRSRQVVRKCFGAPTFDIARNTLNLIYNQSLFWMVHYFSPPMSLIVLVKLLITFYVKKCELLNFCEPPSKFWRAAQTQTLFLALTFLGMISAISVLSYVFIYVDSSSCGPFAGRRYTWEVVVDKIFRVSRNSAFWHTLGEIANPGTGLALLLLMCVAVFYLRAKAEASKQMVQILREMLVWQARDKEFLVKSYSSATNADLLRRRQSAKLLENATDNTEVGEVSRVNEPSTSY